jgi:adenosylcobinamide-GDP ribazoletransferase
MSDGKWLDFLSGHWQAFLAAVGFLTRLSVVKVRPSAEQAAEDLRRGMVYFPLVGALIGLTTGVVVVAGEWFWQPGVAVLLGLALEAWLTGAFHEDAVADFCDAFGGGWTTEDVLRILKDSRIGTYGALGLLLAVLLRWSTLQGFVGVQLLVVSVASSAWGRLLIVVLMTWVPPVPGRAGLARDIGPRPGVSTLLVATMLVFPALGLFVFWSPLSALLTLLTSFVFVAWLASLLQRRLGGLTGDCLGFACYMGQLILLLAAAARLG